MSSPPVPAATATRTDSGLLSTSNFPLVDDSDQHLNEEALDLKARDLRAALEVLLERYRRCPGNDEEQDFEAQFVLLVSAHPEECLRRAVLLAEEDRPGEDNSLRLPVHLACDNNVPVRVIRALLDADASGESVRRADKWGDLPIHTACSRNNLDVVRLLLDFDGTKESILRKDVHDSLPIHMACRYNAPAEVLQLLLDSDGSVPKRTLREEGVYGQYPIHVACRGNPTPDVLRVLLDEDCDKATVLKEDNVGRLPVHVYLLRNKDDECVRMLLGGMVTGRIQRVGLDLWKRDLRSMLRSMETYERDFMTREKLDVIGEALREFMERAFLLELAVWKASCLGLGLGLGCVGREFDSMEALKELGQDYKRERRIKSGAEVIIPGVLSFLEDEPICYIVDEIRTFK
mmetsp:Transcript_37868/g.77249  ORF Transcript_37868/g.77249 Transcript_37868/m.77249 type:complete len:404 (-) Transcript_37868:50-1261(-)